MTISLLWDSFEIVKDSNGMLLEAAQCTRCKKVPAYKERSNGTRNLSRHQTNCSTEVGNNPGCTPRKPFPQINVLFLGTRKNLAFSYQIYFHQVYFEEIIISAILKFTFAQRDFRCIDNIDLAYHQNATSEFSLSRARSPLTKITLKWRKFSFFIAINEKSLPQHSFVGTGRKFYLRWRKRFYGLARWPMDSEYSGFPIEPCYLMPFAGFRRCQV